MREHFIDANVDDLVNDLDGKVLMAIAVGRSTVVMIYQSWEQA